MIWDFIGRLLIGTVWCFGVYKLFDDLLLPIRSQIEQKIGFKWSKPLVLCPPCMGSLHGLILGLLFFGAAPLTIILYCISLCGLNYIIQTLLPEYE